MVPSKSLWPPRNSLLRGPQRPVGVDHQFARMSTSARRRGRRTAARASLSSSVGQSSIAPCELAFAATMAELHRRDRAHLHAAIGAHLMIVPDAGTVVGLTAARLDCGFFAENDAGAASRYSSSSTRSKALSENSSAHTASKQLRIRRSSEPDRWPLKSIFRIPVASSAG